MTKTTTNTNVANWKTNSQSQTIILFSQLNIRSAYTWWQPYRTRLLGVNSGLSVYKEGNVLFNDTLNTFYLRLYGVRHMVKDYSDSERETRCHHIGYSFRLAARVLLYAPSHRQDSTYHSLCYTSRGALARTRNSSMGPPHEGSIRWPIAPWANALTTELHLAPHIHGVS